MLITSLLVLTADPPVFQHQLPRDRQVGRHLDQVLEALKNARPDLAIESANIAGTRPDFEVHVVIKNAGLVNYEPDPRTNYQALVCLWHRVGNDLIRLADSAPVPALNRGESATVMLKIQMPTEGAAEVVLQWDADPRNDRAQLHWVF